MLIGRFAVLYLGQWYSTGKPVMLLIHRVILTISEKQKIQIWLHAHLHVLSFTTRFSFIPNSFFFEKKTAHSTYQTLW